MYSKIVKKQRSIKHKMEIKKIESIIEAILFCAGRQVTKKELLLNLEISEDDLENIITNMQEK